MSIQIKKILSQMLVVSILVTTLLNGLSVESFGIDNNSHKIKTPEDYRKEIKTKVKPKQKVEKNKEVDILFTITAGKKDNNINETRINENVVNEKQLFSALSNKQKKDICDFLQVESNLLRDCEKNGFNLRESIEIVKLLSNSDLSIPNVRSLIEAYGGYDKVGQNLIKYLYLKRNKKTKNKAQEYEKQMLKGYNVDSIYRAGIVAEILGCSVDEIIKPKEECNKYANNAKVQYKNKLEEISDLYDVKISVLERKARNNGITISAIEDQIKSKTLANATIDTQNQELMSTYNSTYYSDLPQLSTKKDYLSTPYKFLGDEEEHVDPLTGALYYKSREIDLKGKNGLDLTLDLTFTSSSDLQYYFDYNEFGEAEVADNFLGVGWSFNLPKIEYDLFNGCKIITLENGGTYKLLNQSTGTNLDKYHTENLRLNYINQPITKTTARYSLNYIDGKVLYFDKYGLLSEVRDRFGNKIVYEYDWYFYEDGVFEGEFKRGELKKITDSLNRVITFLYSLPGEYTRYMGLGIVLPDGYKNYYVMAPIEGHSDSYKMIEKTKVRNNIQFDKVEFEYECPSIGYNLDYDFRIAVLHYGYCLNLTEIIYNNKATSKYTYQEKTKNFLDYGCIDYFRVFTRERLTSPTTTNESDKYEIMEFRPQSIDYTGYPTYYNIDDLPGNFSFFSTEEDAFGTERVIIFNNTFDVQCVYIFSDSNQPNANWSEHYLYDYYGSIKTKLNLIGNMFQWEKYNNDEKGNVTEILGLKADGNWESSYQNKAFFTYDPRYNLMTSKSYNVMDDVRVDEIYTPSQDGKTITTREIKENNVLKEKTGYVYDSYGNVITEKKYKNNFTDYSSVYYSYTDNVTPQRTAHNGVYLTSIKTTGVKDADGNLITPISGYNPGEIVEKMVYDNSGNIIEHYDGNGNKTSYEYDSKKRITEIHNPDNTFSSFNYNDNTNTLIETNENNLQLKYQYNPFGKLTHIYDVTSGEILALYKYDKNLRVYEERNHSTNGYINTYIYDALNRVRQKESRDSLDNTLLAKETTEYEDGNVSITDENGNTMEYIVKTHTIEGDVNSPSIITKAYSNRYNEIEKKGYVVDEDEYYYETYKYGELGNLIEKKSMQANGYNWDVPYTYKVDLDYAGRKVREYDVTNNYISYEYDSLGRLISVADPESNASANPYYTTYTYDNADRVLTESKPLQKDGGVIQFSVKKNYYDKNSNIIKEKKSNNAPGSALTFSAIEYEYNNRDMLIKVKDGVGNYTQYYYDSIGNPRRVYNGLTTPLTISGLDQVSGATGYAVSKYDYSRFGELLEYRDPSNQVESFQYDYNGNLEEKIDRNNQKSSYTYDGLGRLKGITTESLNNSNIVGVTQSFDYALTGLRTKEAVGAYEVNFQYDAMGMLKIENEPNIKKEYMYNLNGNPVRFEVTVGTEKKVSTEYLYDIYDRLNLVSDNNALVASYEYDLNGNKVRTYYYNGTDENYSYNLAGLPSNVSNKEWGTVISSYDYQYYTDGNQREKADHTGQVTTYQYDNAGRLQSETETKPGSSSVNITYEYDKFNNRYRMTYESAEIYQTTYHHDLNNRLLTEDKKYYSDTIGGTSADESVTRYQYDKNGNTTLKTVETIKTAVNGTAAKLSVTDSSEYAEQFEYNAANQLTKYKHGISQINYQYRPNGLRSSKTEGANTTRYIWGGDKLVLTADGNDQVTQKFTYGNALISMEEIDASSGINSGRRYYMHNAHGDVVNLTDETGAILLSYDYDAFGNEKSPNISDSNPFRYCGEYWDSDTGTYYLRARNYDPSIGRFQSEDTHWNPGNMIYGDREYGEGEKKAADILAINQRNNLYAYCMGNPLGYRDENGEFATLVIGGITISAGQMLLAGLTIFILVDLTRGASFTNAFLDGMNRTGKNVVAAIKYARGVMKSKNNQKGLEKGMSKNQKGKFQREIEDYKRGEGRGGGDNVPWVVLKELADYVKENYK